jgi:uncharacterized protein (TIGR00251 family)
MDLRDILYTKNGMVILKLHVKPNSQNQKLVFDSLDNKPVVFLKSPPDKGKANKELIKFLAKYFGLSTSEISIISGHTSREKTLMLETNSIDLIESKIKEKE